MHRPPNPPTSCSLLAEGLAGGEGGYARDGAAHDERVHVVRALVRVDRLEVELGPMLPEVDALQNCLQGPGGRIEKTICMHDMFLHINDAAMFLITCSLLQTFFAEIIFK